MKTYSAKPQEVKREWFEVDAEGMVLGRLATKVASVLRGKHKAEYTPHVDTGDYIVITNAEKVRVTGNKFNDKMYYHHTGHPGGIKSMSFKKLQDRNPVKIIELAVKGMLPKNKLGREISKHIRIYKDTNHGHEAQQPKEWSSN